MGISSGNDSKLFCGSYEVDSIGTGTVNPRVGSSILSLGTNKIKGLRIVRYPFLIFCYHFATIIFKNGFFQPGSCLFICGIHKVGIHCQSDHRACMAQLILDIFDIFPLLN